ncbi:MAG: dicarboxylate/amino acid:cation symporter [Solobacterium sp.]|nr:dicarboxylate/amino acid:cation symporter [Solobacterium sp.]
MSEKKKKYNVTLWIVIGLFAGIALGLVLPSWLVTPFTVISSIYMSALRMMIYPLVFTSLVVAIIGIGSIAKTGKISLHALLWYTGTTAFASGLGLILPRLLHLGEGITITATGTQVEAATFTGLLDTLQNLIPSNPFLSFTEGNMLQVLVFAVIIGLSCLSLKEKAEPVRNLCQSIYDISIFVVGKVMNFTPLGVFTTIALVIHANGTATMIQLAQVMIAMYVVFVLYAVLVYGGMVKFLGKYNPIKFFKDVAPAALHAFGTCSSNATLPISMQCATENIGIPKEIVSLTLPLGATINMDAVSIVMSFMITFFASALGIPVSIGTMATVLAANVLLSIGTPGVPGGAIAAFAALAPLAGLPLEQILGVYISVNTLADMGATCVNVLGDLACSTVLKQTLSTNR